MMRFPTSPLPWSPRGIALSDSEKAEALADSLETQFQPVIDPSAPAVIERVDVVLRSYFLTSASEPNFINPDEVHETIKVSRSARLRTQMEFRTGS